MGGRLRKPSQKSQKSSKSGPTYYTQTSSEIKHVPDDFTSSFGASKLKNPGFKQGRLAAPKSRGPKIYSQSGMNLQEQPKQGKSVGFHPFDY
jgi:hypothetical protein